MCFFLKTNFVLNGLVDLSMKNYNNNVSYNYHIFNKVHFEQILGWNCIHSDSHIGLITAEYLPMSI